MKAVEVIDKLKCRFPNEPEYIQAVEEVLSTIEDGFALPSIEKFEEQITPRTKGILICNPNNPTGYLYTKEEMKMVKKKKTI